MPNSDFQMTFKLSPEAQAAFQDLGRRFKAITVAFKQIFDRVSEGFAVFRLNSEELITRIRDLARAGIGEGDTRGWQSYMCAAWLHDSCQTPSLTQCGCTCHGGTLK